jgi:cytochrome c553
MRENLSSCIVLIAFFSASTAALAANAEAAKPTATGMCAACHGANGISAAGNFPNLAGQKEEYLATALKAYRDKTRNAPIMNNMAASLKDEDIANLAAYFSSLKPTP